jgi:predicted GIY-YIG superfamily endonuclease
MAWTYILKGSSGRYHIGSTPDLDVRFAQQQLGHTHTTKRIGEKLELVASKEFFMLKEAREMERRLKRKKNPLLAIYVLQQ